MLHMIGILQIGEIVRVGQFKPLAVAQQVECPVSRNRINPAAGRSAVRCILPGLGPYLDERFLHDIFRQFPPAQDALSHGNKPGPFKLEDQAQRVPVAPCASRQRQRQSFLVIILHSLAKLSLCNPATAQHGRLG